MPPHPHLVVLKAFEEVEEGRREHVAEPECAEYLDKDIYTLIQYMVTT